MAYPDRYAESDDFFDIEEFLRDSQHAHQHRLEDELEWIDRRLQERDRIHNQILDELESKLDWYYERLEKLYKRTFGQQDEIDELKESIAELNRHRHQEKREHWRDKQELEERRQEVLMELEELDEEMEFLDIL